MLRPPDVLYRPTMLEYGRVPVASRFNLKKPNVLYQKSGPQQSLAVIVGVLDMPKW